MTHYLKTGDAYYPSSHAEVLDRLPPSTYGVAYDQAKSMFYLERMPVLSIGSDGLVTLSQTHDLVRRTVAENRAGRATRE